MHKPPGNLILFINLLPMSFQKLILFFQCVPLNTTKGNSNEFFSLFCVGFFFFFVLGGGGGVFIRLNLRTL